MTILITGSTGLLGQALSRRFAQFGDVVGLSRHAPASAAGRHVICDLTDARRTAQVIQTVRPEVLVHTQAQSDVDRCELEPEEARAQNVETTAHVVEALRTSACWLVYVSTDYVFDGRKGAPYDEQDAPHPISVYGRTKLEAEYRVLGYPRGLIVRPSTLFGPGRMNFCDRVAQAALAGITVEAFEDQATSPSFTEDVAETMHDLIVALAKGRPLTSRIYHVANTGGCTRLAFARRVVELLGCSPRCVRPVRMAALKLPARRPTSSILTTVALPPLIGRNLRSWEDALRGYLRQRYPVQGHMAESMR
ncbi:MAG: NAD(P)-dependent oxidoreductase [Candidatus Omnitrophica bacterium]|nr:NAD(P)-dependent oxidoreductase [Candidatus Omnitrophota bacterium]